MKIIQISDLHFGYHHHFLMEHFLKELRELNPDVIIISGDITHRAAPEQFKAFCDFVKQIPKQVMVVPGNHDIPLHNIFARIFYPFHQYKKYVNSNLFVEWANNEVRILGVNSVNPYRVLDGKLANETLDQIHSYFSSPFAGIYILFFHHNFDYLKGMHAPLENYEAFIEVLKDTHINLVCTGHLHYASVDIIEKNNQHPCVILHAGSLLCKRTRDGLNSYFVMDIKDKFCHINLRIFKETRFESILSYDLDTSKNFFDLEKLIRTTLPHQK